jgi:hypothetical protein
VQNALHMGWAEYCAALYTAVRMREDIGGRTLLVHNGDVSYAECGAPALPHQRCVPAPASFHRF